MGGGSDCDRPDGFVLVRANLSAEQSDLGRPATDVGDTGEEQLADDDADADSEEDRDEDDEDDDDEDDDGNNDDGDD